MSTDPDRAGPRPGPAPADPAGLAAPADPADSADPAGPADSAAPAGPAAPAAPAGSADSADLPVEPDAGTAAGDAGEGRRGHAVRGVLAAGLILEGITVLFVPLAVARGDGGLTTTKLVLLLVLAAALFVAAGMQRRRAGLVLASALQVAVVATGLMVTAMYFLGLLFAGVWAYLLWVRQEIIRAADRAAAPS